MAISYILYTYILYYIILFIILTLIENKPTKSYYNIIKYKIIKTPPWTSQININIELEKYKKSEIYLNLS